MDKRKSREYATGKKDLMATAARFLRRGDGKKIAERLKAKGVKTSPASVNDVIRGVYFNEDIYKEAVLVGQENQAEYEKLRAQLDPLMSEVPAKVAEQKGDYTHKE